ncbi:hypothetical protein ACFOM8_01880 [Paracoccus angustae]|uniref:Fibronectin type-III domain-containing protein n=1 Tax=Paracoccus angustae TaxID=1671480 RepID=A0ABV7TZG0_9RHOB
MLQYIRDNFTAVYLTDANGVPTQTDMLDANGVSLLSGTSISKPNTFAVNQWSVTTGPGPREITITVSVLPAANGSPITAIQYRVGTGAWVNLDGTGTGSRTVTMAAPSTEYSISLRAVNVVGPGDPSTAKAATSGAPAATAPAQFGAGQWSVSTGTGPAEIALNIISLPATGGRSITAIEYRIGSGEWVALDSADTGPRAITMPAASTAYSITLRAVNAVGQGPASAAKTATSAAPALAAPSRVSDPVISGGTTVGSTLTRQSIGEATGNPVPTAAAIWEVNGTIQEGQTGATFSTSGLAAGDKIRTGTRFWNSQGELILWSPEWTLTAQPTLTATVSTLTAGQQATVTFNEAPDTVTVAQGGTALTATRVGTTKAWTFTPATDAPVTIGATLAGYTAYSATLDVQPAPPALVITSANTGRITGVDAASAPFDLQIIQPARYAGTRTVTPSQMAAGPVAHVAPTQSGTGTVGQVLTGDPGLWLTLADDCDLAYRWTRRTTANTGETPVVIAGATGMAYTLTAADQGKTVRFEVVASDQHGERTAFATGTAVPAVSTGIFPTFKPSATTSQKGKITPQPNGDLLIEWDAAANTNPRVYCDVTPGQAYELRTELEFGGATRIIGRLADAGGSTGTDFFDITKTTGQTTLSRTDTFTPAAGRVAMHYIFVMPNGATAKILATTRLRSL